MIGFIDGAVVAGFMFGFSFALMLGGIHWMIAGIAGLLLEYAYGTTTGLIVGCAYGGGPLIVSRIKRLPPRRIQQIGLALTVL